MYINIGGFPLRDIESKSIVFPLGEIDKYSIMNELYIFSSWKIYIIRLFLFILRVLKRHRGFILTQKGDIKPPKNSETHPCFF